MRQATFNGLVVGVVLIVIIVVLVVAFTRPTITALPDYLSRCISASGPSVYKSTPQLSIIINDVDYPVARRIGILGQCYRPIFTLTEAGTIHITADEDRTYTLGDFFLVWGNTYGSNFATFNRNQLFYHSSDAAHPLTMTVNGVPEDRFENYPFPRNANTTLSPVRIVIQYG